MHAISKASRRPQRRGLPPIGQGRYSTLLWPSWLPRTPSDGPTAPQPLRCQAHGEALHTMVEHPTDAEGRGLEVGFYAIRAVVWCAACERGVASEEIVHFVPGRWRDRSAQLLAAATYDSLVRAHALTLFHAFARGGWRLYDELYAVQEGVSTGGDAGDDPEGVA